MYTLTWWFYFMWISPQWKKKIYGEKKKWVNPQNICSNLKPWKWEYCELTSKEKKKERLPLEAVLGRRKDWLDGSPLCDSAELARKPLFIPSGGPTEPAWGIYTQNPNTVLIKIIVPFSFWIYMEKLKINKILNKISLLKSQNYIK